MLLMFTLTPSNMFITLAVAIVYGPTEVFFRYLSYAKMTANKIDEMARVCTLIIKDKISAKIENTKARMIAIFLEILPDGRGLFGLSFLSIVKSK